MTNKKATVTKRKATILSVWQAGNTEMCQGPQLQQAQCVRCSLYALLMCPIIITSQTTHTGAMPSSNSVASSRAAVLALTMAAVVGLIIGVVITGSGCVYVENSGRWGCGAFARRAVQQTTGPRQMEQQERSEAHLCNVQSFVGPKLTPSHRIPISPLGPCTAVSLYGAVLNMGSKVCAASPAVSVSSSGCICVGSFVLFSCWRVATFTCPPCGLHARA